MAITGIGGSYNVYESTYAAQKNEVAKKAESSGVKETSEAKTEITKKSSNEEYLKSLQKQVPDIKLQIGYGINTQNDSKTNVVDINPALLEKMQNDPEAAKKYTQYLKNVEGAIKWANNYAKSVGDTVVFQHGYVDENGKYYNCAYIKKEDKLSPKLREERRKNAEKLIEKTKEKAAEKKEKLEEILEKRKVAKTEEKSASNKAEQLVNEKIAASEDGVILFDDDDMQTLIEAAKEKESEQLAKKSAGKEVEGTNFDMKI